MLRPAVLNTSLVLSVFAQGATAQVIDFETAPGGGTPTDNTTMPLVAAYIANGIEVSFGFDTTGDGVVDTPACFEAAGDDGTDAFNNNTDAEGLSDTPRAEFADRLGDFFLRSSPGVSVRDGHKFIVTYSTPVIALGGEIWDLESGTQGGERFQILAFDESGNEVASQTSPLLQGIDRRFDSAPWTFFLTSHEGIVRLEFEYIGTSPHNVGFAFDNFNANATSPTPTLLSYTPFEYNGILRDPAGVGAMRLVFSEAVALSADDIELRDAQGQDVPFTLIFESAQVVRVQFDQTLYHDDYEVTLRETIRSLSSHRMLDGDDDGVEGGDRLITLSHRCPADIAAPLGRIDVDDVFEFIDYFMMCH